MTNKMQLTEAQVSQLDILNNAVENDDSISDEEFTNILYELKDQAVDVESVLRERYGVEF